jgi:hypothetical protein
MEENEAKEAPEMKPYTGEGIVKGKVFITVYENRPIEAHFEGDIKGNEMVMIKVGISREYRKWKIGLAKSEPVTTKKEE